MSKQTALQPSASFSLTIRVELQDRPGVFARVATAIGKAGGNLGAVDLVDSKNGTKVRDVVVAAADEGHARRIAGVVHRVSGAKVLEVSDRTFRIHQGGKIEVVPRFPVKSRDDLSMIYTPGVGRVCMAIHRDPALAMTLTIRKNTIAIVSDGTAVLGLGDIGPLAAMPVMEGKAILFKVFAGVDAFPICLDTKDVDEIVETVCRIAPSFGGINLEDISAPRCFEIEKRLKERLDIPVMHDDQHGTAVVVLAGMLNALKVTGRPIGKVRAVVSGAGAAAVAVTEMLVGAGMKDVICCDRAGAVYRGRAEHMNPSKVRLSEGTNPRRYKGDIGGALKGANVFIGLSVPGTVTVRQLRAMAKGPIIFGLANPVPEVMPEDVASFAAVVATGRSDYPNQINNALAFPGIFRGALDAKARAITDAMMLAAARAIAAVVTADDLSADYIVPSIFNPKVAPAVSAAVSKAVRK